MSTTKITFSLVKGENPPQEAILLLSENVNADELLKALKEGVLKESFAGVGYRVDVDSVRSEVITDSEAEKLRESRKGRRL